MTDQPWPTGVALTSSGIKFDYRYPTVEMIEIDDIAHQLAQTIRWGGCAVEPITVAQHCVVVSYMVHPWYQFEALLHDAPEAYLGDMRSPMKAVSPEYQRLEQKIWLLIAQKFGLNDEISRQVHAADKQCQRWEGQLFMPDPDSWFEDQTYIPGDVLRLLSPVWSWEDARDRFLARYDELARKELVSP